MELVNCLVALRGDRGTTVPKYRITPAEVAVLATLHGMDAVFDVEILPETVDISVGEMMEYLDQNYGNAVDHENRKILALVYPGRTPVLHTTVAQLDLPPEAFKVERRAPPAPKAPKTIKPARAEKPAPVPAPLAANEASADNLFEDDDADPETVMG